MNRRNWLQGIETAPWVRQCLVRATCSITEVSCVLRFPKRRWQLSGRSMTSEMICRADIICNISSYHIFLIGGYQLSVFLIDSSNIDTLSAVYSSLIAGQTLLKCQYLLFFLEHHFFITATFLTCVIMFNFTNFLWLHFSRLLKATVSTFLWPPFFFFLPSWLIFQKRIDLV